MRISIRDKSGQTVYGVQVDTANPPAVARPPEGEAGQAVTLNWDRALDDEGRLRRCPVCGCPDLFLRKQVPQLTGFALIVLAAIVAMVLFGIGMLRVAVAVLILLLAVDLGIFLFSKRRLECYRCHSQFRGMPIPARHPRWERQLADHYQQEANDNPQPPQDVDVSRAAPADQRQSDASA